MEKGRRFSRQDLARSCGCSIKALRLYESHGLVGPSFKSGRKRYDDAAWARLKLVVALRNIGLSMDGVGRLLDLRGAGKVHPSQSVARIADRISEATRKVTDQIELYQRVRQELCDAREVLLACGQCGRPLSLCQECISTGKIGPLAQTLLFDP